MRDKGWAGGSFSLLCISPCSKKKHKAKKRKREEDAAEQLDIVGELLSKSYVTVETAGDVAEAKEVVIGLRKASVTPVEIHNSFSQHALCILGSS